MSKLILTNIKNNDFEETRGSGGGMTEDGKLKSIKVISKKTN